MIINKKILQFFSVLSDETRLRILVSLIDNPLSVNDIHDAVGKDNLTLSAISHQLRQLNDLGIVEYERIGREKLFKLSDGFCWCILKDAFSHFDGKCACKECLQVKKKTSKILK